MQFIDLKAQYKVLKNDIDDRIQRVLDHGQFIMGPEVEECEKALADYIGSKHCITCSSGTDAAVIAMMAWDIGPGDEVIVPDFSFIATAETVVLVGAVPIFVDVDPVTYNIDVEKIEAAISKKTKAIAPVSLYGQPPDMDAIASIARKHGLLVLEDGAQSFGGTYRGKKSLNISDVGFTSFFPSKPLGCYGDGGAIFTNNDDRAAAMKSIRFHGQTERYHHVRVGMNGRMDTLQCAILLPKLARFPWELESRQRLAIQYNDAFSSLIPQGVVIPRVMPERSSAWAQYTLQVPHRARFQEHLKQVGIPTAVHYPRTMSQQPAYTEKNSRISSNVVSRQLADRVVSLPLYPDMDEKTQKFIVESVLNAPF